MDLLLPNFRKRVFFHPPEEVEVDAEVLSQRVAFKGVPRHIVDLEGFHRWVTEEQGADLILTSYGWAAFEMYQAGPLPDDFVLHFRRQAPQLADWGDDFVRTFAPSSIDNKATIKLQGLDVTTNRLKSGHLPAFFNYRPSYASPGMPLTLAHPVFASFLDTFEGVGQQPQQEDNQFFLKLAETFSSFFTEEADYRDHAAELWKQYTGVEFTSELNTGGGTRCDLGARILERRALFSSLEAKLGVYSSKSEPGMQSSQYVRRYWNAKGDLKRFSNTCYPALAIEQLGCNIRVSAVATLDRFCCMPLTPFINLLCIQGHNVAAAEQGARLCLAVKTALRELLAFYTTFQSGPRRDLFIRGCIPYPLHDLQAQRPPTRYGDKLVYLVEKPGQPKMVVKFVQRPYGDDVHRAWAAAGYAPQLYDDVRLPGGWWQVSMEFLGEGWKLLQACPRADELRPSVLVVLARAHRVAVNAAGHVGVHGDMRDVNVMVKWDEDGNLPAEGGVKFIDFDWARRQGDPAACYPHFMNHSQVNWPEGVSDGQAMLQEHDTALLSLSQDDQRIDQY